MHFQDAGLEPHTTWLRKRSFPPARITERTRGVGAGAYYYPMGKRAAQDPIAENLLGPYWTPSSTRRPAKSPNFGSSCGISGCTEARQAGPRPHTPTPRSPRAATQREAPPAARYHRPTHLPLGPDPSHTYHQIPPPHPDTRATPWFTHRPFQMTPWPFYEDAFGCGVRPRCQLSGVARPACGWAVRPPPAVTSAVLLLEQSQPTHPSPARAPAASCWLAAAVPIAVLDMSLPIATRVVPIGGSPHASPAPATGVHSSSPRLSQADTPPPGSHPPRR